MFEELSYRVSILRGIVPKIVIIGVLLLITFLFFYFKILPGLYLKYKTEATSINETSIHEDVSQQSKNTVFCEISGAVNEPNVYSIFVTGRLFELIQLAKGFSNYADIVWISKNLNLALKIEDECKIYIPFIWDSAFDVPKIAKYPFDALNELKTSPGKIAPESSKVVGDDSHLLESNNEPVSDKQLININSCDITALTDLKGIGPAYAARIIQGRPYKDFTELLTMSKVPTSILEDLKEKIKF